MQLRKSWIERTASVILSFGLIAGVMSCSSATMDTTSNDAGINSINRSSSSSSTEDKTGVMLQGFTWSSASSSADWYNTMLAKASDIKDNFDYVWFPPPSMSASTQGYLPTQLNNLNSSYGTADELASVISAISPAKAIADVVINHRCGTTDWGDFTNPSWNDDFYSICSDDEGFTGSSTMAASSKRGNADTGEGYSAARDIDHTNYDVQNGIVAWMNDVLKGVGFVGWRYDFVKGYNGYYVGKYNSETEAEFSVGEYWPTDGFNKDYSYGWSSEIQSWVNATSNGGYKTRAFDFVLKGNLNYAFGYEGNTGLWDMSLLADSNNLFRAMPEYAVTFIDNHDTGSTQRHWAFDESDIAPAYAFLLTHPGYPCVAWQHYFTGDESQYIGGNSVSGTGYTLREHIDELISIRKENGICYDSNIEVLSSSTYLYVAKITGNNGSLIVKIGGLDYTPSDSSYSCVYSGTNFAVWSNLSSSSSETTTDSSDSSSSSDTTETTDTTDTTTSTEATYRLISTVSPGYGYAVYFTGSFNEASNWTVAVRGTYSSDVGGWYVDVTGSDFEWKYMTGLYSLGETVSTSTSGLTWQSGSNSTVSDATLISEGTSTETTESSETVDSTDETDSSEDTDSTESTTETTTDTTSSTTTEEETTTETTVETITLSVTYNTGSGKAIYFTGTFDEGNSWSTAVRGTWTTGNVWTATVTVPSSGSFSWKCLLGDYSLGETTSVSNLTWESGSNHTSDTTSVTPSF